MFGSSCSPEEGAPTYPARRRYDDEEEEDHATIEASAGSGGSIHPDMASKITSYCCGGRQSVVDDRRARVKSVQCLLSEIEDMLASIANASDNEERRRFREESRRHNV